MTVIAACLKDGKMVIGADSQISTNTEKYRGIRKITKFNDSLYVGFCGTVTMHHVLDEFAAEHDWAKKVRITDIPTARSFARGIWERLGDDLDLNGNKDIRNQAELMIVTPTTIYCVDPYFTCQESTDYASIGSGSSAAKAALKVMKDNMELDSYDMIRNAIEVTCYFDLYCSLPMYVFEVKDSPLPKPKKKPAAKKKRKKA